MKREGGGIFCPPPVFLGKFTDLATTTTMVSSESESELSTARLAHGHTLVRNHDRSLRPKHSRCHLNLCVCVCARARVCVHVRVCVCVHVRACK